MEGTNCGLLCQHPCCWSSAKADMINAFKKTLPIGTIFDPLLSSPSEQQQQHRHAFKNDMSKHLDKRAESLKNSILSDLNSSSWTGSLPTLKVVNLLHEDVDSDDDSSERYQAGYHVPIVPPSRETTFPLSSTKEFGKASRFPRAPCASPSPSFSSLYLKKLRQRSKQQFHRKERELENFKEKDKARKTQPTQIQCQNSSNEENISPIPYMIWIPSKNKKKRKKCKSADGQSTSEVAKVSMKTITGNNPDFGFLETPFNQDKSSRSFSRTTHISQSSPSRLYPRRLPPMTRDILEGTRSCRRPAAGGEASEMQLHGDGLLREENEPKRTSRFVPATPKNTRASDRLATGHLGDTALEGTSSEKILQKQNKGPRDVDTEADGPFVIQNGHQPKLKSDYDDCDCQMTQPSVPADIPPLKREELALPRVSVPKDKLKQLPIENHCRNSIPSHQMRDIRMQPIEGTGATPSCSPCSSLVNRIISEEVKNFKDSLTVEPPYSTEDYVKMLDSEVLDERLVQDLAESLVFHWQAAEEIVRAPAPTPSSPMKRTFEAVAPQNIDVIPEKPQQQQQEDDGEVEPEQNLQAESVTEKVEEISERNPNESMKHGLSLTSSETNAKPCNHEGRDVRELLNASPIPSKASLNDWPSNKDIMRQTYEKYRSLTPFKSAGVSLEDARADMMREIENKPVNARVIPANTTYNVKRSLPHPFYEGSEIMQRYAMHPRPQPAVMRALKNAILTQRQYKTYDVSELSIRNLRPSHRNNNIMDIAKRGPLYVDKKLLVHPSTKTKFDHMSSYEIYEALLRANDPKRFSDNDANRKPNPDSDKLHIVLPVPNSTPYELTEAASENNLAMDKGAETFMIINALSGMEDVSNGNVAKMESNAADNNAEIAIIKYAADDDADAKRYGNEIDDENHGSKATVDDDIHLGRTLEDGKIDNAKVNAENNDGCDTDVTENDANDTEDIATRSSQCNAEMNTVDQCGTSVVITEPTQTGFQADDSQTEENQSDISDDGEISQNLKNISGNIHDASNQNDLPNSHFGLLTDPNLEFEEVPTLFVNSEEQLKNLQMGSLRHKDNELGLASDDFDSVSIPDMTNGFEMSLDLSEELKNVMQNIDDFDVNSLSENES